MNDTVNMKNWKGFPGSTDPEVIRIFEQLREEEQHNCRQCQEEAWGPKHFLYHSIVETDEGRRLIISTGRMCGGNGRRFDIEQRQFIGRAHCTCEACY